MTNDDLLERIAKHRRISVLRALNEAIVHYAQHLDLVRPTLPQAQADDPNDSRRFLVQVREPGEPWPERAPAFSNLQIASGKLINQLSISAHGQGRVIDMSGRVLVELDKATIRNPNADIGAMIQGAIAD